MKRQRSYSRDGAINGRGGQIVRATHGFWRQENFGQRLWRHSATWSSKLRRRATLLGTHFSKITSSIQVIGLLFLSICLFRRSHLMQPIMEINIQFVVWFRKCSGSGDALTACLACWILRRHPRDWHICNLSTTTWLCCAINLTFHFHKSQSAFFSPGVENMETWGRLAWGTKRRFFRV